jgi:DNA polymerase-3 subunit alpha
MPSPFIHLHAHSHYSLLRALPTIDELVGRAKELDMDAIALTDYAMYGAIEFYKECQKQGIKPIMGFEAYMAKQKMSDKRPRIDDRPGTLVLLAETTEGYRNLLKLTTLAHLEGFYYKPRIDKEILRQYGKGVIALIGDGKADLGAALAMDEFGKAEGVIREYVDILGEGNVFLELRDHPEMDDQVTRNRELIKLSKSTGVPLVATKDVHYLERGDADAHDVLMSIDSGKPVTDESRPSMLGVDYSFTDAEHMAKAFADVPEAITNTRAIADRCKVEIEIGKWYFADIKIPDGTTYDDELSRLAYEGAAAKVPEITEEIKARIEYELGIIRTKGYAPYFLVVSDYMRWAKEKGIVTTTRGSAAGSFVSYAIDIVPVNPLSYKLPFERFLNPFRPSAPDIDGDFADARRDEVIAYVTGKYGQDKVAQIGTFGTMQARAAVRDVGRALGFALPYVDRIAKLIPMGSQGFPMTIDKAIELTPELRALLDTDPQAKRLLDFARRVEGRASHVSVHAAGVVIAPRPLTDFCALQREPGGDKIITQFDMHAVEDAGVLKMDFLGIRNLSILGNAVEIIKKTKGIDIDIRNIPLDDPKTYQLLARGDTIGLFQLNGDGMTRYLKELKPSNIFDIMAMVALYRPGPIESIPEFIRRKHNPSLISYLDPRLKEILNASYGVITFQDDVMLTAIHLGGYNWEEADKLRKAMGKKIPAEMAKQKDKLLEGFVKNGLTEEKAQRLWSLIEPFAAYGFNKAHAAAYAMVAYQTAYLKANWTAEFMTAVLTAEAGDAETIADVVNACEKMGIEVLPPDVNSSGVNFTYIDDTHVRFGLLAIKGLGQEIAQTIIDERDKGGAYTSIADLSSRIDSRHFNKRSLEVLVKSGATDSLDERNRLLASIDQILLYHKNAVKDRASGQDSLFGGAAFAEREPLALRAVPEATQREKLAWEKELLGLYVSEHPFREYEEMLRGVIVPIAELASKKGTKGLIRVGGTVTSVRKIMTKNDEPMAFAKLEDTSGAVELVIFPGVFRQVENVCVPDVSVIAEGKYSEKEGQVNMICEAVIQVNPDNATDVRRLLASAAGKSQTAAPTTVAAGERVFIAVPPKMPPSLADELKRILADHPGSRRVFLLVRDGPSERRIETSYSIAFSSDAISAIERLVGRGAVLATT